jgi:hypothetical protein
MIYTKMVEENSWEGETWIYFYPKDVEFSKAVATISKQFAAFDIEDVYTVHDKEYSEKEVDYLVNELEDIGSYHSLVSKNLVTPENREKIIALANNIPSAADDVETWIDDAIYALNKGAPFISDHDEDEAEEEE